MIRPFDLRPRASARRAARAVPPARMVLCLRPQSGSADTEPVVGERLLIGGDPHCDVCLMGDVPDLHTILAVDGSAAWADVVIGDPPLRVNGVETDYCQLRDGDVIEIGPARFEVTFSSSTMPAAAVHLWDAPDDSSCDSECNMEDLERLSAEELADLIEEAEREVQDFESRERLGWKALARAVRGRGAASVAIGPVLHEAEAAEDDLVRQMDQLSDQLDGLAGRLASRADELADREIRLADAAAELADIQRQLDERLAALRTAAADGHRPRRRAA